MFKPPAIDQEPLPEAQNGNSVAEYFDSVGKLKVPYKDLPKDVRKQVGQQLFTLHRQGLSIAAIARTKGIPERQVSATVAVLYRYFVHESHAIGQEAALIGFLSDVRFRQRQLWTLFSRSKNDVDAQLKVIKQLAEEEGRALELMARMDKLLERLPSKDEVTRSLAGQAFSMLAKPEDKLRATDLLAKMSGWTSDGGSQTILFSETVMKAAKKYMTKPPEPSKTAALPASLPVETSYVEPPPEAANGG